MPHSVIYYLWILGYQIWDLYKYQNYEIKEILRKKPKRNEMGLEGNIVMNLQSKYQPV